MAYQVALLNFEGPLDLLLQLIERSELSITEISLSAVTEQYLGYIDQLEDLDPQELNRFIDLASRLIYAKSRALLPAVAAPEDDAQLEDLEQQLERYRHYREAALFLQSLLRRGQSWQRPVQPETRTPNLSDMSLDLGSIRQAFNDGLARQPAEQPTAIMETMPTMEEMMTRIDEFVRAGGGSLNGLFGQAASQGELVLTFVAILEMIKAKRLKVSQNQIFGTISLDAA